LSRRTASCNRRRATAIMNTDRPLPFDLAAVRRKKLTVDFEGGNQSSDAGLLLLREAERKFGEAPAGEEGQPGLAQLPVLSQ
jgi:hypothetical protein